MTREQTLGICFGRWLNIVERLYINQLENDDRSVGFRRNTAEIISRDYHDYYQVGQLYTNYVLFKFAINL